MFPGVLHEDNELLHVLCRQTFVARHYLVEGDIPHFNFSFQAIAHDTRQAGNIRPEEPGVLQWRIEPEKAFTFLTVAFGAVCFEQFLSFGDLSRFSLYRGKKSEKGNDAEE